MKQAYTVCPWKSGPWWMYYPQINSILRKDCMFKQWHNRQGAECPPKTSDQEILANVLGKKRQGKKGKRGENVKKENCIREGGKLEMEVGKFVNRGEDLFFFFFFAFQFHFWKWQKFVLGLPKWEFSTGKKHFTPGKNQEKWFCPLKKICLLCPCV